MVFDDRDRRDWIGTDVGFEAILVGGGLVVALVRERAWPLTVP